MIMILDLMMIQRVKFTTDEGTVATDDDYSNKSNKLGLSCAKLSRA